ncbi:hypothetical protein, partial [Ideonella azotifigens]|uniref:hypothetical protein n=1 Tax=Ideonella azotifigens TaxID=513160 RepID=UPI001B869FE9
MSIWLLRAGKGKDRAGLRPALHQRGTRATGKLPAAGISKMWPRGIGWRGAKEAQNGMSSSMSSKPVDDFGAGLGAG